MEQFAGNVIDYFEDTYIRKLRPNGHRRAPLFDLALWNMYDQTIGDFPRTNNAVEGWHRRFQANVGAYRPNFWKFIDILKREQSLNHVNISQARAGHQPEPQRRRYQDSNRRIKNIVQDYHNRDRLQYLRGLAHNISMWRNGFFKNHQTTGFMPPKTVLLRTTNLP